MPKIRAGTLEEHQELVWGSITAALGELLAERDYESVTFGHIAERSGLARNTLYNYASDKTTLMLAIAERESRPLIERIYRIAERDTTVADRMGAIIDELMHAFVNPTIRLIAQPSLAVAARADSTPRREGPLTAIAQLIAQLIREGSEAGEFHGVDDEHLTAWLLGGIVRSAAERIVTDELTPQQVSPTAQRLVIHALGGKP